VINSSGNNREGRKVPINEHAQGPEEAKPDTPEEVATHEAAGHRVDVKALAEELEKARAEAAAWKDKYLRLYAETENFRKRMNREMSEREKYHNEGIIKELLPVLDNLERAISHAKESGPEGVIEGVKMVKKQLMDALSKFGVTQVESIGFPFDPEKQQAMMQVETADYEPGTVVEEFQKGYFLNDRILRPAMVTVAKPPKDSTE